MTLGWIGHRFSKRWAMKMGGCDSTENKYLIKPLGGTVIFVSGINVYLLLSLHRRCTTCWRRAGTWKVPPSKGRHLTPPCSTSRLEPCSSDTLTESSFYGTDWSDEQMLILPSLKKTDCISQNLVFGEKVKDGADSGRHLCWLHVIREEFTTVVHSLLHSYLEQF